MRPRTIGRPGLTPLRPPGRMAAWARGGRGRGPSPGIDTPGRPGRIRDSPRLTPAVRPPGESRTIVSAPQDSYEAARADKLRRIEQLGVDPWGGRFDGHFGKPRPGEPTLFADGLTFLGKSLLPPPKKIHGVHDIEFRLRHRYLDLIYTPETLDRTLKRVKVVRTIRNVLDAEGYVEVE